MNEIICPHCHKAFQVDEAGYADLLKQVRDITSLDVKRADFKLDMLSPHLFMNFRLVDEHGGHDALLDPVRTFAAEWRRLSDELEALAALTRDSPCRTSRRSSSPLPGVGMMPAIRVRPSRKVRHLLPEIKHEILAAMSS